MVWVVGGVGKEKVGGVGEEWRARGAVRGGWRARWMVWAVDGVREEQPGGMGGGWRGRGAVGGVGEQQVSGVVEQVTFRDQEGGRSSRVAWASSGGDKPEWRVTRKERGQKGGGPGETRKRGPRRDQERTEESGKEAGPGETRKEGEASGWRGRAVVRRRADGAAVCCPRLTPP